MRILREECKVFTMHICQSLREIIVKSACKGVFRIILSAYNGHFKGGIWSMYKQIGQSLGEITENADF